MSLIPYSDDDYSAFLDLLEPLPSICIESISSKAKQLILQNINQYTNTKNMSNKSMKLATEAAERILEAKRKIKELTQQMESDIALVRDHAKRTGHRRYGTAEVYERKNPKQLVLPDGMTEESLRRMLCKTTYRGYIISVLDTKRILDEYETNNELNAMMEEMGIEVQQDSELHFKAF